METGLISHLVAAVAYTILTLILVVSWKGRWAGAFLVLASGATAAWGAAMAYDIWLTGNVRPISHIAEVVRSAAWLTFLFAAFAASGIDRRNRYVALALRPAAAALCLGVIALDVWNNAAPDSFAAEGGGSLRIMACLMIALLGLTLVENLFRNTSQDQRWKIKFLCFGVGGLFAYDFFLYSDSLLFQRIDPVLLGARGFTNALVVPFIAVSAARNPQWSLDVFVSRRIVFHTAALIGGGVYLLLMAAAGYYLREFGGGWGPIVQVTFLTGAVLLLFTVLFSGRARAQLKVFVSKHFFSYKYDYRDEWLRFIHTISSPERSANLRNRVIQAVADIMESPGGALWLRSAAGRFTMAESWNLRGPAEIAVTDETFIRLLEQEQTIINLENLADPGVINIAPLTELFRDSPRFWLVIPLVHRDRLMGLLVLEKPRATRALNWEDYDLLRTVARQAASYLAEEESGEALAEARQFEAFNRRFAFIMHDIKGIVSELSLIASNAAKHGQNPAFQADMVRTVEESVGRMNRLLTKLKSDRQSGGMAGAVDLETVLRRVVKQKGAGQAAVELVCEAPPVAIAADPDRFAAVVGHLVQNAVEAVAPQEKKGRVEVRLGKDASMAVIDVRDNGPGMDADFIRNHLFRPFRTTKEASFGIGLYETRDFARQHGGNLEVLSTPGQGTTMRLTFPLHRPGAATPPLLDEASGL